MRSPDRAEPNPPSLEELAAKLVEVTRNRTPRGKLGFGEQEELTPDTVERKMKELSVLYHPDHFTDSSLKALATEIVKQVQQAGREVLEGFKKGAGGDEPTTVVKAEEPGERHPAAYSGYRKTSDGFVFDGDPNVSYWSIARVPDSNLFVAEKGDGFFVIGPDGRAKNLYKAYREVKLVGGFLIVQSFNSRIGPREFAVDLDTGEAPSEKDQERYSSVEWEEGKPMGYLAVRGEGRYGPEKEIFSPRFRRASSSVALTFEGAGKR